ncbi:hypothetical protein ACFW9X_34780, partial [Streptomyces sp. NPDC059466]
SRAGPPVRGGGVRAAAGPPPRPRSGRGGGPPGGAPPTARARGLLALAAGEPDSALAEFEVAAEPVRSSQPQLARLRLARARALRRTGRPGTAAHASRLLREALRVAEAYGMAALAAECAALLDSTADA